MDADSKSRQNLTPLIHSTETRKYNKSATNQGKSCRQNRPIKPSSSSSDISYFKKINQRFRNLESELAMIRRPKLDSASSQPQVIIKGRLKNVYKNR